MLKEFARIADMDMLLHDETIPGLGPLQGIRANAYRNALAELEEICPLTYMSPEGIKS